VQLGGPFWKVKLGRRDSKTGFFQLASSGVLPGPSSSLSTLISNFKDQGLSTKDMVALSGICPFLFNYIYFCPYLSSNSLHNLHYCSEEIFFIQYFYNTDKKKKREGKKCE